MDKIIAFFMSIIAFFTSFFGTTTVKQEVSSEGFEPILRFMVCSDTHINGENDSKLKRIEKAYAFARQAASESTYTALDAAVFAGDCTDDGTEEQFAAFKKCVTACSGEDTELLIILADHHDGYQGMDMLKNVQDITGYDSDWHTVINGYHFIGISASTSEIEQYSLYQRKWLKEQLKQAVADDPDKPIFVYTHEHIWNTVYGSSTYDSWGITYFKDILESYPQVVHFSGHSHYPLNDPRSILQGDCTTVGTGTLHYVELRIGLDRKLRPSEGNGKNVGQAWLVEVDANNRVRLRGFNSVTNEWLCDYVLEDVDNKDTYVYTEENMKALSSAPAFDEDATVSIVENEGKYDVTVPAAKSTDGKIIFLYRIKVKNKLGTTVSSDYILNNYWQASCYESVTFSVEAKSGYTVEITAENAYEMASDPLTATIE